MEIVTDTHSLIWYLESDKKLSKKARGAFFYLEKGKGRLIISTVVFLETLVLVEKKRVKFSWKDFYAKLSKFSNTNIYPVNENVIRKIPKINPLLELHDRILVTTAVLCNAPLISKDPEITKTKGIRIIW